MTSAKTATLDKMTFAVLDSKTTNVAEMNCAVSNSKKATILTCSIISSNINS